MAFRVPKVRCSIPRASFRVRKTPGHVKIKGR